MTADGRFRDRYPGPWTIEEGDSCLVVRAPAGEALVYIHYRDAGPEWRMGPIWRFSPGEARAFARAITGLAKKKGRKDPAQSGQLDLFQDDVTPSGRSQRE